MSDPVQPTDELTVQANAMMRTITVQRDEALARETNTAGTLAIVSLRLEKAQNELAALREANAAAQEGAKPAPETPPPSEA